MNFTSILHFVDNILQHFTFCLTFGKTTIGLKYDSQFFMCLQLNDYWLHLFELGMYTQNIDKRKTCLIYENILNGSIPKYDFIPLSLWACSIPVKYILSPTLSRYKISNDSTSIIQNRVVFSLFANAFHHLNMAEEHQCQFEFFLRRHNLQ